MTTSKDGFYNIIMFSIKINKLDISILPLINGIDNMNKNECSELVNELDIQC